MTNYEVYARFRLDPKTMYIQAEDDEQAQHVAHATIKEHLRSSLTGAGLDVQFDFDVINLDKHKAQLYKRIDNGEYVAAMRVGTMMLTYRPTCLFLLQEIDEFDQGHERVRLVKHLRSYTHGAAVMMMNGAKMCLPHFNCDGGDKLSATKYICYEDGEFYTDNGTAFTLPVSTMWFEYKGDT